MGAWSTDIMGSDTAYDVSDDFDELPQPVSSAAALTFIADKIKDWGDDPVIAQVVGFVMIEKSYPMTPELKARVVEGIDAEDVSDWGDPEERSQKLAAFKQTVLAYPEDGAKVTLPPQEGLFDVITKGMSQ